MHEEARLSAPMTASLSDIALRPIQGQRRERIGAYARGFAIERQLAERIYDAAVNEEIDPELAFRLVKVESSFRQRAGLSGSWVKRRNMGRFNRAPRAGWTRAFRGRICSR